MQLDNLNITSILIFLTIIISSSFLIFLFFKKREKLKKKYFLLFNQKNSFYFKYIYLLLSLIIILFGIFEIKYGEKEQKTKVNGIDIVFVLDVSKSMNALDFTDSGYHISRLNFSKTLIADYVLKNTENRYSLVIFAGDAISISPLTTDSSIFLTFLENVDYRNLSKQGTNLEKAMLLGVNRLNKGSSEEKRAKALILLSDGGDFGEKIDFDYIEGILTKDITNFIIGIGKTIGAKIPIGQDYFGNIQYQTFKGTQVITKLNEENLKKISTVVGGDYVKADDISDLERISYKINTLEKKAIFKTEGKNKKDFGRILSILSMLFFLLYLIDLRKKS